MGGLAATAAQRRGIPPVGDLWPPERRSLVNARRLSIQCFQQSRARVRLRSNSGFVFQERPLSSPGFGKRQKELRRKEQQEEKAAKKAARKIESEKRAETARLTGEDPDLIGIVPGPQPPLF